MRISVSETKSLFKPVTVDNIEQLERVIRDQTYSLSVFRNNHRVSEDFQEAHAVGLDFDGGLSITEAAEVFKDYKHLIAPTRNHQKAKKGVISDRFRVILFLSSPILSRAVYENTVKSLLARFPQADRACKDVARMFYPSTSIYSRQDSGLLVDPIEAPVKMTDAPIVERDLPEINYEAKPHGWSNCKWALANGYYNAGEGNEACMAIVSTCRHLNMTKEQAYYVAKNSLKLREARTRATYDKRDLWREVMETVYSPNWRGAVYTCGQEGTWLHSYCQTLGLHSCSHTSSAFKFKPIGKILQDRPKVNWLVDGLLTVGGLSLIVGKPKSGKSTITRQLAKAVATGTEFFDRPVQQGEVLYLALEEQEEMLYEQFKRLGVQDSDPIQIHVGGLYSKAHWDELVGIVMERRPRLLIIDTLLLFVNFKDVNNYNEVNDELAKYRKLARESGTHIITIHHQNKSDSRGATSILGSSAIHGAVDCAIIFNHINNRRFISSSQRGGRPFRNQEALFDSATETYTLGEEDADF